MPWLYIFLKIYDIFQMFKKKRKLVIKYTLLQKEYFLLKMIYTKKRKKVAPSIIGKHIFKFLICGCIDIWLIKKWPIFANTDIWIAILRLKMWKCDIWLRYLNLKKKKTLSDRQKKKWISLFDRYPKNKIAHNLNFWCITLILPFFFLSFSPSFSSLSLFLVCHEHLGPWIISLVWALPPLVKVFKIRKINPLGDEFPLHKKSSSLSIMILIITWIIYT